jgi:hypothetical protein
VKRFFFAALAIALVYIVGESIYKEATKSSSSRLKRIACHSEVVCFERLYGTPDEISTAKALLQAHRFRLNASVERSVHMKSRLFEVVKPADVEVLVDKAFKAGFTPAAAMPNDVEPLTIDYYIYENDKLDPGKKTPKSKLYTGYLVFNLIHNGKKLYKFQIDFMDPDGKDIEQRIRCAVESIRTL